jgi:D-glycero-D-manno-heptose 1,7-bisphosphate phosphatase
MLQGNVVFLDRDGVINKDSADYIKNWDEFEFLPGSLEALRLLTKSGRRLVLITNQSIINRGMVPLDVLNHTHACLRREVSKAGGRLEDIFFCPHRPDENCSCRKPKPGLIEQATRKLGIAATDGIMIGDSAKDILCGRNAGCSATILVRTGNGCEARKTLEEALSPPDFVVPDLLHAARLILSKSPAPGRNR